MWRKQFSIFFFVGVCTHLIAQPTISVQPAQVVVAPGQSATFSVVATADCPLTYQWQFKGSNLPNGVITTVAGDGNYIYGDDGPAKRASFNGPHGLALDTNGNIYVADSGNHLIRVIGTNGIVTRVAGIGNTHGSINPGSALGVSLNTPSDVCLDSAGNYYFSDQLNHRICKVDSNGNLSIFAGKDQSPAHPGFSGDGGPAFGALLNRPVGITFDTSGNLYIADRSNNRIRKVDTNGIITTVAGSGGLGGFGYGGDGGYATNAVMNAPGGVAFDAVGNMFIADTANHVIRKVDTNGIITTVAGNGTGAFSGDNGAATNASLNLPESLIVDPSENLWICDAGNNRIRRVDTNGIITTINFGLSVTEVLMDPKGNLFIAAAGQNQIMERDTNGVFTVMGGTGSSSYTGDGGPANMAYLAGPTTAVADPAGKIIIADQNYQRIRQVSSVGIIVTLAGTGAAGFSGDGNAASKAKLNSPYGVAMDGAQNIFFSDFSNHRVRKIDTKGVISTVAGNGTSAFAGDNGVATNASLNNPAGLAVDVLGNLFIADQLNNRIRKVDTNGIITTVAGSSTNVLYAGNGGYATNAGLFRPRGVAVDAVGNLFIADTGNNRIRKVDTNGIITLLAGTNSSGFSGDGGLALTNKFASPAAVAVDGAGNVFVADELNDRIRKIDTNGIITTAVGNGVSGFGGEGGIATNAAISLPTGISFDSAGNLIIAELGNYRVRKVVYSDKPSFTVFGVNTNNIGDYQVIVSGACGSVTSSVAKLFLSAQIQTGTAGVGIQENCFGFTVTGTSNQTVIIEASTNLNDSGWLPLATNILGADPYYFNDPDWTNHAERFYRTRSP